MLTYEDKVKKPRLEIVYDSTPTSPRDWSNVGKFITVDSSYSSPDEDKELQAIVKITGNYAESAEHHMELIKEEVDGVVMIVPISKYEHGGVSYSIGFKHGFDYSNNGFYIVLENDLKEITEERDEDKILEIIKGELEVYNKYANGEVYGFTSYDENGNIEDSCYGFYDIEEIKSHLGDEFKDENLNDYIKY